MAKKQDTPALIPEAEQPYPIPENWRWVRLDAVCSFEHGITFPKEAKEFYSRIGNIPCLRTANIQEYLVLDDLIYVDEIMMKGNLEKIVRADDIIFSSANSRERVGKSVYVEHIPFPMTFGGFVLNIRSNHAVNSKFLFWFLRYEYLIGSFISKATQTTNIANINTTILGNCPLSLPPLAEQQRIVDRIESLFAKLDAARDKAQAVLDEYEQRRAAILHRAFTGELTAKWRAEQGISLESWVKKELSDVSTLHSGIMKGKRYQDSDETVFMPYLRVANVQDGFLNLDEIKQIEVPKALINRYLLREGDVLFTEGGDFDKLGRGTVWRGEIKNCLHQNHIFAVRTDATVLIPAFLSLQAGSLYGKLYFLSCSKQTVNLASMNSTQLKKFPVILPCVEEQKEIIHLLDNLLEQEQRIKEDAETVLARINMMKKAILGRAFRGQLGTNDLSEQVMM